MPNGARRRMETADARSVELLRQDYLPLAQTHGVPAVRDGAGGPWVKALSNFFLIKANQHLEAICALLNAGLGEDAQIIARTLFEHSLHLAYVAAPDDEAERERRAEHFAYDGDRQRGEKARELERLRVEGRVGPMMAEIMAEAVRIEPVRSAPPDFLGVPNLKQIAISLGDPYEDQYHVIYWGLSKIAHPSALGAHGYLDEEPEGDALHEALAWAFPTHFDILRKALELAEDRKVLEAAVAVANRFVGFHSSKT